MSIIPFEKSFASHEKAKFWSSKNKKTPRDVYKSTATIYWFVCPDCNHEFYARLYNIIGGKWCNYCSNKILCCDINCKICLSKSFASHKRAKCWSSKNKKTPRDCAISSNKKFWFICHDCNHEFDSALNHIVRGGWCPYCSSQKLCNDNMCEYCLFKSFASHEKSKFWSSKNKKVPREVFRAIAMKYWFDCPDCNHDFDTSLNNVTRGRWCPTCKNKTELKLFTILKPIYPCLIKQFKQEWCKNKQCLPFDFCIPELKVIIELDGLQHFKQISNWPSPEKQFENDKYKETCANENGYSVIRILQEDVFNDTYDWCKELCRAIEEIKNGVETQNIYLDKNEEYKCYK